MSSHLLPSNATAEEVALSLAIARDLEPEQIRLVWRPEDCQVNMLPWLAWAFHVDDWDDGWNDTIQRASIRNAMEIHRRKGTKWSILNQLAVLGYLNVEILEKRDVDALLRQLGWLVLDGSWKIGASPTGLSIGGFQIVEPGIKADIAKQLDAEGEAVVAVRHRIGREVVKIGCHHSLKLDGTWKIGESGRKIASRCAKIDGTWKIGGTAPLKIGGGWKVGEIGPSATVEISRSKEARI